MLTLYVIKSCDTCRKARKALDSRGIPFRTHDLRDDGVSATLLDELLARVSLATLLNKRSTTWRSLDEETKVSLDTDKAKELMQQAPTLLKRPLLDTGDDIIVGYRDGDYDALSH
ncbi:Spx/MgsR family RNA polymerase-binding regulatory protein [Aidingimonas lacisalsi]|uniref:Spx/MgsR family RNA polymerase-binding regulatory protein n=1 Tax=Aidingimonas lacisalsi TaxID=2604086 RepID=UPI0011D21F1B|nr:Spx/MgsR family RNA polymerase-binding regulatory protein [Aidingimonas lacisalsi]